MTFENDSRWDDFLTKLHLLSDRGYSGTFPVHFHQGRISRSTMKQLHEITRPLVWAPVGEEVVDIQPVGGSNAR